MEKRPRSCRGTHAEYGRSFFGAVIPDQFNRHAFTRSTRDVGDGNSFGHTFGSGRRPVYYNALWQVRSRGLPLCSSGALRHRTAADGAVMIIEANPDIVTIPEGFFLMGSESSPENEMPRHRVWVDSFGLGKFPGTNREYRIVVEAEQ